MAQAAKLRIEFGEDPNLEKWQSFLAAHRNVTTLNDKLKDASQEAKLWTEDKEFRARMIMQQLRGEPLIWLSQDEYTEVLKDDAQVITALEERYGHTKARVSYIKCQQDEYPIRAMCCLIRPADESATIRLVDCGTQEEVVRTVETVGMAFEVVLRSDVEKGDHRSISGYEIDTRLDRNKQQEFTDLINKYGDIF